MSATDLQGNDREDSTSTGTKVSGFLREPLAREIVDGITGPRLTRTFNDSVKWYPTINRAHLVMLVEQHLIEPAVAANLLAQIDVLEQEGPSAFSLDPEREDPWFNYETELTKRAGPNAGRLHLGRSRNDLKVTQDRLQTRELAINLIVGCSELRRALLEKGSEEAESVMPGYTHLQHAQPMTFGWYLLGIEAALARDAGRIWSALVRMDQCPLGAGAFAGTRLPICRERTAELLGFAGPQAHSLDAVANPDALVELVCAATQLSLTIGRMCQDLYLWSTFEFRMIEFPDSIATTSSIMPQKKNLTVLENFKARPAVLLGALSTAIASLRGTPFGHSQEVSVEANRWIWDAMREFNGMLPVSKLLVLSASAKRDRMAELTRANFATATSLADLLTTHHDISFRQAHHLVGHYVRLVMEGMDNQEALRTAAVEELKQIPEGIEKVLREVLDPAAAIEALSVGPSRSESERLIHEGKNRLEKEEQTLGALRRRLEGAARILSARCEELMHPAHGENVQ